MYAYYRFESLVMYSFKLVLYRWILVFFDPRKILSWIFLPKYFFAWRAYQANSNRSLKFRDSYPCLSDWVGSTPYDPHYFFQGAWLSRRLANTNPMLHIDIGSSVLSVGVISGHTPTVFVDYRPLNARLDGMLNVGANIVQLPFADSSVLSLSCMHVIEHIGLGRYGDPIDPNGAVLAASELSRVLAPNGRLYLTTPVGRERVCFNAHRVFSPVDLPFMFKGLSLIGFAWVDDVGQFHAEASPADAVDSEYACGFYEFEKLDAEVSS